LSLLRLRLCLQPCQELLCALLLLLRRGQLHRQLQPGASSLWAWGQRRQLLVHMHQALLQTCQQLHRSPDGRRSALLLLLLLQLLPLLQSSLLGSDGLHTVELVTLSLSGRLTC
jgi:hypothetical protein